MAKYFPHIIREPEILNFKKYPCMCKRPGCSEECNPSGAFPVIGCPFISRIHY